MTQPGQPWMGTKGQEASYVWFGKLGRRYGLELAAFYSSGPQGGHLLHMAEKKAKV